MILLLYVGFFFFKQKTAYDMRISDWSSDVCSSDLKAAVNCLTLYVATQYGRRGIRCNAIFPGLVLTPTTEAVLTPEQFAHIQLNSLSPFPSTAEDAAAAVAFLASDDRSEEHTSELQSLMRISYAVFCLKKKKNATHNKKEHRTKIKRTQ